MTTPRGEYFVEHRRPRPEYIEAYMPLWHELLAATDPFERIAIVARMARFQQRVGSDEAFPNILTTLGKNDVLDQWGRGAGYTQTLVMGLKGTGTPVAGDTQASHAGWLEQGLANAPSYAGNRKAVVMAAAAAGIAVSAAAVFAITSGGTVAGAFINNGGSNVIDSTTGVLVSVGNYISGDKVVVSLDTLSVTYTLTCT